MTSCGCEVEQFSSVARCECNDIAMLVDAEMVMQRLIIGGRSRLQWLSH